jgi:hypothetical protein
MNHFISMATATEMIHRYADEKEKILKPEFQNENLLLTCETFDRDAFDALLAQDGCKKIRIYFGMTGRLQVRVIAFGVNEKDENMFPADITGTGDGNHIVEEGLPCPDFCPPPFP